MPLALLRLACLLLAGVASLPAAGQPRMPAQLQKQQWPDDPTDFTGIVLVMAGEDRSLPAGEIRIRAEEDQPGHRGHGDVDAGQPEAE